MIIDQSKGPRRIKEFNEYLRNQLAGRIDPSVPLIIEHTDSKTSAGVQFADLFAWGVFQKYEREDTTWYNEFSDKILYDKQYL